MRRSFYLAPAMVAGLMATHAPALRADEAAAKQAIIQLLEIGWGDSFRILEPAQEQFEKAKAAFPRDPRVPLALALVQIKHGKHAEAAWIAGSFSTARSKWAARLLTPPPRRI